MLYSTAVMEAEQKPEFVFTKDTHIEGILPKGPYLPCIKAWRVGPFWQDTIDISCSRASYGMSVMIFFL